MRKPTISKKKAATGRPVVCSTCYVPMKVQLRLDRGEDWLCERCGKRHKKS